MAVISTFSTLKTAVADYIDRDDISAVGGPIDQWVSMMEAELYRDLRIRFMESAFNVTIASQVAALPADFLEAKFLYIDGQPIVALQSRAAFDLFNEYPNRAGSGKPKFFAQVGDNLEFGPSPDSGYAVKGTYYALPTDLSTSNETNWLTTNAPDVLLNGTLLQSLSYLGMDERAEIWQRNYSEGFKRLMEQDQRVRFPDRTTLAVMPG